MEYEGDLTDDEILDAVGGVDYVGADGEEDVLALLGEPAVGQMVRRPSGGRIGPLSKALQGRIRRLARQRVRAPAGTARALGEADELAALIKSRQASRRLAALDRRALSGKQPTILLGIDSQTSLGRDIAANETITIATEAVDRMRIIDFQVRGAIAGDFLIGRIQVQRTNLLSGGAPVPADIFAAPDRPPLESPVLYPGTELLVEVINLVAAARRFTGQFRGIDLDEDR